MRRALLSWAVVLHLWFLLLGRTNNLSIFCLKLGKCNEIGMDCYFNISALLAAIGVGIIFVEIDLEIEIVLHFFF